MIEDIIERYFKFNTKICTYKLIFGNFNDETIPPNYYNLLMMTTEMGIIVLTLQLTIPYRTMKEWTINL